MPTILPAQAVNVRRNWHVRALVWVLFFALLRGLVPHVALAAIATHADPVQIFCLGDAPQFSASATKTHGHESCVCASGHDGFSQAPQPSVAYLPAASKQTLCGLAEKQGLTAVLPPACGPPSTLAIQ